MAQSLFVKLVVPPLNVKGLINVIRFWGDVNVNSLHIFVSTEIIKQFIFFGCQLENRYLKAHLI